MLFFMVFGLSNVIGATLIGFAFTGLAMNFFCYLCERGTFIPAYMLWWSFGIGFLVELVGVVFGILLFKKGH